MHTYTFLFLVLSLTHAYHAYLLFELKMFKNVLVWMFVCFDSKKNRGLASTGQVLGCQKKVKEILDKRI